MFCTTLRRRPSFSPAVSSLTATSGLLLRESQLSTHDISIPLTAAVAQIHSSTASTRQLRVLLLSPSSVSGAKLEQTMRRIEHFASLTGGQDLAMVFLLASTPATGFVSARQLADNAASTGTDNGPGVHAFTALQAHLTNRTDIPYVPIIPLTKLDGLPALLLKHVANLTRPCSRQFKPAPTTSPVDLLQLCTASPPMSRETAYLCAEVFPTLQDLAEACTSVSSAPNSSSPSARAAGGISASQVELACGADSTLASDYGAYGKMRSLRDLVGAKECRDIVDFFKEEWVVD